MANPTLIKQYECPADVLPYRIVKFGAADHQVAQAAAAADLAVGVSNELGGAAGGRVDVVRGGLAEVEYGAAVTRGQQLTSDADGRAVPAAAGNRVIGVAEVSGVLGDVGEALIAPSVM